MAKIMADDGIVDQVQKLLHAWIRVVQIGIDRDTHFARPTSSEDGGGLQFVTIQVKKTRTGYALALDLVRMKDDAFIPAVQYSPLTEAIHRN